MTKVRKIYSCAPKNGGRNRFIAYTDADKLKPEDLVEKASALFLPEGKSSFVCNRTGQIGQFGHETANYAINKAC